MLRKLSAYFGELRFEFKRAFLERKASYYDLYKEIGELEKQRREMRDNVTHIEEINRGARREINRLNEEYLRRRIREKKVRSVLEERLDSAGKRVGELDSSLNAEREKYLEIFNGMRRQLRIVREESNERFTGFLADNLALLEKNPEAVNRKVLVSFSKLKKDYLRVGDLLRSYESDFIGKLISGYAEMVSDFSEAPVALSLNGRLIYSSASLEEEHEFSDEKISSFFEREEVNKSLEEDRSYSMEEEGHYISFSRHYIGDSDVRVDGFYVVPIKKGFRDKLRRRKRTEDIVGPVLTKIKTFIDSLSVERDSQPA